MVTATVFEISGIWFYWTRQVIREYFTALANLGRIIHLSWPKRDYEFPKVITTAEMEL